jgi:hypothetical protein
MGWSQVQEGVTTGWCASRRRRAGTCQEEQQGSRRIARASWVTCGCRRRHCVVRRLETTRRARMVGPPPQRAQQASEAGRNRLGCAPMRHEATTKLRMAAFKPRLSACCPRPRFLQPVCRRTCLQASKEARKQASKQASKHTRHDGSQTAWLSPGGGAPPPPAAPGRRGSWPRDSAGGWAWLRLHPSLTASKPESRGPGRGGAADLGQARQRRLRLRVPGDCCGRERAALRPAASPAHPRLCRDHPRPAKRPALQVLCQGAPPLPCLVLLCCCRCPCLQPAAPALSLPLCPILTRPLPLLCLVCRRRMQPGSTAAARARLQPRPLPPAPPQCCPQHPPPWWPPPATATCPCAGPLPPTRAVLTSGAWPSVWRSRTRSAAAPPSTAGTTALRVW